MLATAILGLALVEPAAVPQPPDDAALRWSAPEGCPPIEHVQARIVEYLGVLPDPEEARIDAVVEAQQAERYRLEVTVRSASGTTRHALQDARCEVLADAVALVAAVALDPLDVAAAIEAGRATPAPEPAPEPAPAPEPTPPTPPETDRSPPPEPAPPRRRPLLFGLRADFALDFGPLPALGVGGGFTGTMLGRGWRVEAGVVLLAPRSAASVQVPAATADVSLTAARMRGCGVLGRTLVEVPLCGGVELGALRGRGTGATLDPRTERDLWSAAILGPGIAIVPKRFLAIVVGVDAVIPFARPAFDLGGEIVHRARPAGVRAGIGLEFRVP